MNKLLSNKKMAALVGGRVCDVWVGVYGYDTRPYFQGETRRQNRHLPVAHTVGFAANSESHRNRRVDAGDYSTMIFEAAHGSMLVIPDYSGCNRDGDHICVKTTKGWEVSYHPVEA